MGLQECLHPPRVLENGHSASGQPLIHPHSEQFRRSRNLINQTLETSGKKENCQLDSYPRRLEVSRWGETVCRRDRAEGAARNLLRPRIGERGIVASFPYSTEY